eukprot:309282_1
MSKQQDRSELLTFGYVQNAFRNAIPVPLIELIQLFYDEWIYWALKDKKLKQSINAKTQIVYPKLINIKGIQLEAFLHRVVFMGYLQMGCNMKYVPKNIESFAYYLEIKCEPLNCSIKRVVSIKYDSLNMYYRDRSNEHDDPYDENFDHEAVICRASELRNLNSIYFNIMVNIKYIKYKKEYNKINYSPINKMQKYSKLTWKINQSLLKRCKKVGGGELVYSPNFDNNNWCFVLYHAHRGSHIRGNKMVIVGLKCLYSSYNIKAMDVKLQFDFNGTRQEQECILPLPGSAPQYGMDLMSSSEFEEKESLSFSMTVEIINIYGEIWGVLPQNKIEQKHWETLGITENKEDEQKVSDNMNNKMISSKHRINYEISNMPCINSLTDKRYYSHPQQIFNEINKYNKIISNAFDESFINYIQPENNGNFRNNNFENINTDSDVHFDRFDKYAQGAKKDLQKASEYIEKIKVEMNKIQNVNKMLRRRLSKYETI